MIEMPKIKINNININYELDGSGEEVLVILNGIMMSTASWIEHVPYFTENNLRVLRVDFRDQGQSERVEKPYTIEQHVEDLVALLNEIGISEANIHGISYGGQVALLLALKYPEKVRSLIIANTIPRMTNYLKGIGEAWDEAAKSKDGSSFFRQVAPSIYSNLFYESNRDFLKDREKMLKNMLDDGWFDAYLRLSSSNSDINLLDRLQEIKAPTLFVASDRDAVTPVEEMRAMRDRVVGSKFLMIPDSGHVTCYEKMDEYIVCILGFIRLVHARQSIK